MKDIPGYEGLYAVREDGTVWHVLSAYKPKSRRGYLAVSLRSMNGEPRRTLSVHRLVANAFIENPDNKPQINHKNGIKTDNRIENLEWCTSKENMAHAWRMGLYSHRAKKLTEDSVREIRKLKENGLSNSQIARKYAIDRSHVSRIISGRFWSHV